MVLKSVQARGDARQSLFVRVQVFLVTSEQVPTLPGFRILEKRKEILSLVDDAVSVVGGSGEVVVKVPIPVGNSPNGCGHNDRRAEGEKVDSTLSQIDDLVLSKR